MKEISTLQTPHVGRVSHPIDEVNIGEWYWFVDSVDAYKPGDFKISFNDPRTRADYVKWAPFLLAAEDYHAGKRKVND